MLCFKFLKFFSSSISPFDIVMKELTVVAVKINPFSFPKALHLIEAMHDKYLRTDKLGIRIFGLHEYKSALEALKNGSILKVVFKILQD